MKYEKAQNILPQNIIELIQQYVDGSYLYIPKECLLKNLPSNFISLSIVLEE